MTEQNLSILVHAAAKVGKTTLSATSPLPILVLDAEGGWKFIASSPYVEAEQGKTLKATRWDPSKGPPPELNGWDLCMVTVKDWNTVNKVYEWLAVHPNHFSSIVIDSITEIQRRCKSNLVGTEAMKIQDWGVLLTQMDSVIRRFRDLTNEPGSTIRCVIFVAETREVNGKYKPYMQGQIENTLPYWMDVVGYLYTEQVPDDTGQTTDVIRRLLVSSHPKFEAGERVQGRLGSVVDRPNVTNMLQTVFPDSEE